ncbi:hypothetical protein QFZ58_001571 [Streptomyces sp. B1I3]|nr:hypothetical protein [Streptomyces sp. B1I3]
MDTTTPGLRGRTAAGARTSFPRGCAGVVPEAGAALVSATGQRRRRRRAVAAATADVRESTPSLA